MISKGSIIIVLLVAAGLSTNAAEARSSSSGSSSSSSHHHIFLGTGLIVQNAGKFANSPDGSTSFFAAMYTDLSLILDFRIVGGLGISPSIAYTPFGFSDADSGEKTRLMPIALRLTENLGPLGIQFGPGLWTQTLSGTGGTTQLNNGTTTATFALPSGSTTSRLFSLDAGLSLTVSILRLDVDAWIIDPASSGRRAVNLMTTLSVGLF